MKYLKISNKGYLENGDLTYLGSSPKRGQEGKIGMFGSGWKYTLALLAKLDMTPIIFSGEKHVKIELKDGVHRDRQIKIIFVDGVNSHITSEAGPKWTLWMGLREIISNAIDEGEFEMEIAEDIEWKGEGYVTVLLPLVAELEEIIKNFDYYFAFERKESFKFSDGTRIFVRPADAPFTIYRKGIRCFDTHRKAKIDIDFNEIEINEDRLTRESEIDETFRKLLKEEKIPKNIMLALLQSTYVDWLPVLYAKNDNIISTLIELHQDGHTFTCESIKNIGGIILVGANDLMIPNSWYQYLAKEGVCQSVFEKIEGDFGFYENARGKNFNNIIDWFKNLGFDFKVRIGHIEGGYRSEVRFKNDVIYISNEITASDESIFAQTIKQLPESKLVQLIK